MRDRGGTFAPISPPEAGYPYPPVKHGPSWTKVRLSNPWLEPHHYTAAIDWMLEVVDGIEEGAFACRERVVGFSANYLLRCDPAPTKIARRGRSVPWTGVPKTHRGVTFRAPQVPRRSRGQPAAPDAPRAHVPHGRHEVPRARLRAAPTCAAPSRPPSPHRVPPGGRALPCPPVRAAEPPHPALAEAENLAIPLPRNSLTLELELLNTLGWELCGANPFTLAPDRLEQLFACDGVLPPTTEEQRARARFQLPLRLYMVVRGREYLEAPDPLAAAAAALDLTLRGALNLDAAAAGGLLPRVCALIDADPDAALDLRTALGAATLLARRSLTARHGG